MKIRTQIIAGLCALALSACQTTRAPVNANSGEFETDMATALSQADPYQADFMIGQILEWPDLSSEQKARALYHRGSLRRQTGNNRLGAVTDFEAMLALTPTHNLAGHARTELSYTRQDIQKLRNRLKRLLTHAEWFDAMWTLGERDQAAKRYQKARLSPTVAQVKALRATGHICDADGKGANVYQLGDRRSDLDGLKWCKPL